MTEKEMITLNGSCKAGGASESSEGTGATGTNEATGSSGTTGISGTTGTSGITGASGSSGNYSQLKAKESLQSHSPQQPQESQQAQSPQQPLTPQPLTPQPFLPKKGNYRDLLVYKKAECLYDITFYFAHHYFIPRKDRTVDQVVQAARSGKQNIAEGCSAGTTSSETEIKLIGVARASMQEVLEDYKDYLRTRHLTEWPLDDPRTRQTQKYCKKHYRPEDYTKDIEKRSPEALCNIAITLICQYDVMMGKLIDRVQKDFVEQGGIRERMTAARLGYRNDQKARIAELEAEDAALKARVAALEARLGQKGGEL